MKGFRRIMALAIVLAMLIPSYSAMSATISDLDNIDITTFSVRYKDNMPDDELKSGSGFTMGSAVWRDYLFVPVNFASKGSDALNENLTQLAVYNLTGNKATYMGSWNKTDLGIPVLDITKQNLDNYIYGVSVSDEYICILVDMARNPSSGSSQWSDIALYTYENNLLGATTLPSPERVDIKTPQYSESREVDIPLSWWRRADSISELRPYQTMLISGREDIASSLIITNGPHGVADNSGYIRVINVTEDETLQGFTAVEEYELFTYTASDGVTVERANYVLDVSFSGDKGYFLTRLNRAGNSLIYKGDYAFKSNALAIFTVSFEDPHNPTVVDVTEFDGDNMYNRIDTITGEEITSYSTSYCNIRSYSISACDDGMAYVTSSVMNTGYLDGSCPHIYVFDRSGTDVTYVARHDVKNSAGEGGTNGLGKVQVTGDILVGASATGYNVWLATMKLSADRTEVLDAKLDKSALAGFGGFGYESHKYGTKVIIPHGSPQDASSPSDTNRGVVNIINVLAGGTTWEGAENVKNNVALEDIYAEFLDNYLHSGDNTVSITGTNTSDEPKDISIIFALYKDNVIQTTKVGNTHTIEAGAEIDFTENIDLSAYENLDGMVLKVYLWEDMTTARPLAQAVSPQLTKFTFTVEETSATSAGVYDENNKLVRTLWGNVEYQGGTYTETWDGLDDWGNTVPDGNYKVKVLTNNVEYEKLIPVIGNTSDCSTWNSFISSYNMLFDMALDNHTNRLYYCSDHVEGGYGLRYLNASDLSVNGALLTGNKGNNTATHVATDGNLVYWGVAEPTIYRKDRTYTIDGVTYDLPGSQISAFIFASDGNNSGVKYQFTEDYDRAISKWSDTGIYSHALNLTITTGQYYNRIGGVEVQQDGDYLISAFRDAGKVYVNNKTTGKDLFSYDITEPSAMAMSNGGGDLDNTIYIAYRVDVMGTRDVEVEVEVPVTDENGDPVYNEDGTQQTTTETQTMTEEYVVSSSFSIAKYTINSDGSLTKEGDIVTGLDTVLAMGLSPDGKTLVACQGGNEDKIFVYNTSDGSLRLTYGTGESYYTDPTVKDGKLMFDDVVFDYNQEPYEHTFAEFLDNDSVLVGDSGNTRTLQLNVASDTAVYEYEIAFQHNTYSAYCVQNDETRIFSGKKEYSLDYDKVEAYVANRDDRYDYEGFRDAWKLERNYLLYFEQNFPGYGEDLARGFGRAVKQSNGYTYFNQNISGTHYIFKQAPDGTLSNTGVSLGADIGGKDLQTDMSLWYIKSSGNIRSLYSQEFTGFDENNNPTYGSAVLRARIDYTDNDKIPFQSDRYLAITDSGKVVFLHAPGPASVIYDYEVKHMHLGALDVTGGVATEFEWLASPGTMRSNGNDFPLDGYFDIQGPPQYTAKFAMAYGNDIIFHYRGEGYKGRQANSFLHFNEDGLLITVCENNLTGYDGATNERYGRAGDILEAQPCNSMSTSMATIDDDTAYIFQNTEGAAGGVHITRITGLTTIKTQEIPVVLKNGMVKGVAYTCYDSDELDSTMLKNRGVSNTFGIPFITNGGDENRSVRFEGYFEPDNTDTYPFAVKTDGKVKMWLDSQLIIDAEGDAVGLLNLTAGKAYKIMFEVCPSSTGTLSQFDVGYMLNGEYVFLDEDKLFCKYPTTGKENKVNLLDGFKFIGTFEEGMYGWSMEKSEQYNENTSANITLSNWNYKREDTVDIRVKLNDKTLRNESNNIVASDQSVNRNLGTVNSNNWKIDMNVRYQGNFTRWTLSAAKPRVGDGTAIEILDKDGKVIATFHIEHNGQNPNVLAKGNYTLIKEIKKNSGSSGVSSTNYNFYSPYGNDPLVRPNELSFENLGNGMLRITYMGAYIDVAPVDSTADIAAPAELRVAGWDNHSVGSTHNWNITKFDLIYDTTKE